ncbi:MAG: 2-dehydro-3-deoxygalactonokinase, partial [Pseudomonadota bacterium]
MSDAAWIAVDWGTSHLRAWIMGAEDAVLSQHASDDGMGTLTPDGFAPALKRLVGDLDLPVIACGMAGSRQGWAEAPYVAVPCKPPGLDQATRVGKVHILPGMRQDQPPEVMRGEETQIAGFLSRDKDFDG